MDGAGGGAVYSTCRHQTRRGWHRTKTAVFKGMVRDGSLPARPGVTRVITEAVEAGWTVAVASTSAEESVQAVLANAVGEDMARSITVFAGDVVAAKKPDPAIYQLAVARLGLDVTATLVVEDSRNGLLAAVGAGLSCLVTVNGYTRQENFDESVVVVTELGDPGRSPIEVLANRAGIEIGDYVTLDVLQGCMRTGATAGIRAG